MIILVTLCMSLPHPRACVDGLLAGSAEVGSLRTTGAHVAEAPSELACHTAASAGQLQLAEHFF